MRSALAQPGRDSVASTEGAAEPLARRVAVALIPPSPPSNPYLSLLYSELESLGFRPVDGRLRLSWLWANRGRVRFIHFNWPEGLYRYERGPRFLRAQLSWIKLIAFAARLGAARALGYRLVWTIHQVYPHETSNRTRDRLAALALARACSVLITHDEGTATEAQQELGVPQPRIAVIPHGSYVGAYPPGRARDAVRNELGIAADTFVFLFFGEFRSYKGVDLLLTAFAGVERDAALVLAGHPKDAGVATRVAAAAGADPRIKPLISHVPDERVRELFEAADAAVLPRGDGGTSGSLLLALSLGLPVVAADRPTYRELLRGGAAGWLFPAGDRAALRACLEEAAGDATRARERGRVAASVARQLGWDGVAARTAKLLEPLLR